MKSFHLQSKLGLLGEELAKKYLLQKGYTVLARNYYQFRGLRAGEIDLIVEKNKVIYFIEVKTRNVKNDQKMIDVPENSVTREKIIKMNKTAQHFLKENKRVESETHFDVIAILYNKSKKVAKVKHIRDIFF